MVPRRGDWVFPPHGAGRGIAPPILFCLAKRECAVHGGREKRWGPNPSLSVRFGQTGVERAGAPVIG